MIESGSKYPSMDIKQCPNCGSVRRLADEVLQQQIKEKKMPKESAAFIMPYKSIVAMGDRWLSAPCILSFYDVCVECGTLYCVHAEVQTVVQGGKPNSKYQAGKGFSPS